jgi:hypothetical protein
MIRFIQDKILHQAGIMASRLRFLTALMITRARVSTGIPFASWAIWFPVLSPKSLHFMVLQAL